MALTAIALNCTLKAKGDSSTDAMIDVLAKAFAKCDVALTETIRIAALDVKTGVTSDEGEGDAWPDIRAKILAADLDGSDEQRCQTCARTDGRISRRNR
jgi:hypothetical protein